MRKRLPKEYRRYGMPFGQLLFAHEMAIRAQQHRHAAAEQARKRAAAAPVFPQLSTQQKRFVIAIVNGLTATKAAQVASYSRASTQAGGKADDLGAPGSSKTFRRWFVWVQQNSSVDRMSAT